MIRLKIEVKNSYLPDDNNNGLSILLYSKETKYVYEDKTLSNVFKTSKISVN